MIAELKALYTDYAEKVKAVRRAAKPFDGVFGFGNDPRNNPCHEAFFAAGGQWAETFANSQPEQEQILEAALFILEEPLQYKEKECYWYMFASHANLKPLIPIMTGETAKMVLERFETLYPRRDRMPLQKELLKALAKAAK